jgi:hypothetical protein
MVWTYRSEHSHFASTKDYDPNKAIHALHRSVRR